MAQKISIVVPCYNEEECINAYYDSMQGIMKQMSKVDFELVFVDDGSRDKTIEIIKELAVKDKRVKYISFSRNFGKEAAMYAGLQHTTGDFVGLMDVDLQDPPELLLEMYKGITEEGFDCVGCRRTDRKGEPPIRSWFARKFYKLINKMSDADITDGARDYRLMTRKMTNAILSMAEVDRFSKGIFGWVGFKTKWLEYKNVDRVAGQTKWNFKKLTKYAIGGIEDFSTAPLKINLFLSIFLGLAAVGLFVADIVMWCMGMSPSLFMTMSPLVCFVGSLVLLGAAVTSDYVAKIFRQAKNRPIYIVKDSSFEK